MQRKAFRFRSRLKIRTIRQPAEYVYLQNKTIMSTTLRVGMNLIIKSLIVLTSTLISSYFYCFQQENYLFHLIINK